MKLQNSFVLILMDKQEKDLLEEYASTQNKLLTEYCFEAIEEKIRKEKEQSLIQKEVGISN